MLKKTSDLTRPTPVRQDAPFRGQGRSTRRGEEVHTKLRLIRSLRSSASGEVLCLKYYSPYVEPLSTARTQLADFLSILQAAACYR